MCSPRSRIRPRTASADVRGYRIAGIVEALASIPLGALWLASGIGVGFCSDGHDSTYCDGLSRTWVALGFAVVGCLVSGLAMIAVAGRPPGSAAKVLATVAYGISAIAAIGLAAWLVNY